ncbi:MAG: alpha/beta hydrolase [Alphaproteobacteria bacterium]|nr:alpha/beta hydrolase [Alphaproteobacteria bacterium]
MIEPILGCYLNLEIAGDPCRIYCEEAGSGIPLLCLHTAGSDARQWRHLLNDAEVTARFRVIAFDMPWHGKSNPPPGWRDRDYRLTTATYRATILAVCRALDLRRPVVMGCSMGGRIVLHLAYRDAATFRAVIGLESKDTTAGWYDLSWLHHSEIHGGEAAAAHVSGNMAPTSPAARRWETMWHYMQGGPGVFKGDLHYFFEEADYSRETPHIDTSRCPVYLLTGEYDFSVTGADTQATAARIPGAKATVMQGLGHFPMSENPERFRTYLLPVLRAIAGD